MMTFSSETIQANGIEQHYYRSGGDKPALVLLHGFTDDALCWLPVAEVLRHDFDVILPDARGHGQSARIAGIGFSSEALADDVAAFIDLLKLKQPPAVVGHSMGGFTALILAARYPELVNCLLLEDPTLFPPPTPESEAAGKAGMRDWAENVRRMQTQSAADLIAGEHQRSPGWSDAELRPWAESKLRFDLSLFEQDFKRPVWQSLMQQVQCPVLLLYGDTGTIVNDSIAQESAALWRSGQAVQLAHAGHSLRRDNFPAYITAVQAFLQQHHTP